MESPRRLSVFKTFLLVSLALHVGGALLIGTVDQPGETYAQIVTPLLMLEYPVEIISVGIDARGNSLTRPITTYHDPEYFGFPRAWAFGKYQVSPTKSDHVPIKLGLLDAPTPWKVSPELGLSDRELRLETPGEMLPIEWTPLQLVPRETSAVEVTGARTTWELVIEGPPARRGRLLQVLPQFGKKLEKNRSLILGEAEPQRGVEGLRLRFWVTPEGRVSLVNLESSSGNGAWDRMAFNAITQWRFERIAGPNAATQSGILRLIEVQLP